MMRHPLHRLILLTLVLAVAWAVPALAECDYCMSDPNYDGPTDPGPGAGSYEVRCCRAGNLQNCIDGGWVVESGPYEVCSIVFSSDTGRYQCSGYTGSCSGGGGPGGGGPGGGGGSGCHVQYGSFCPAECFSCTYFYY